MANSSLDPRILLVTTNFETRIVTLGHKDESFSVFKERFCKEHKQCFPQVGEINVTEIERRGFFYHLPDSMIIRNIFCNTSEFWFLYADLVRVDKTIMPADQNEKKKKKKTTIDTVPIDDLTSGEAQVAKKRKLGIESCEKIGNQQSPDAELVGTELTDESGKSCGKVASDDLRGAIEQDGEKGEKTGEIEQDKDVASTLDGDTSSRGDVICEKVQQAREKLDDSLSGAIIERGLDRFIDNERDIMNEINGVDATSESALVNPLAQAIQQKENEKFALETDNDPANHLEANNNLVEDYIKDPRSDSFSKLVDTLMPNENENSAAESKEDTHITDGETQETVNHLQAAHALVQESNIEVGKDDVEMEAKSVKTSKKRKLRKDKRRAKEGRLVAMDVEPIKVVVDGEEGSGSLKEKEENVEKSEEKSSKTLKKPSANVVEVVLGLPAINKPEKSKNPKQRKSRAKGAQ